MSGMQRDKLRFPNVHQSQEFNLNQLNKDIADDEVVFGDQYVDSQPTDRLALPGIVRNVETNQRTSIASLEVPNRYNAPQSTIIKGVKQKKIPVQKTPQKDDESEFIQQIFGYDKLVSQSQNIQKGGLKSGLQKSKKGQGKNNIHINLTRQNRGEENSATQSSPLLKTSLDYASQRNTDVQNSINFQPAPKLPKKGDGATLSI